MICYIGIGSNLGDRQEYLRRSIDLLKATEGMQVRRKSPVYEIQPWGGIQDQPDYLNMVVEVEWPGSPAGLFAALKGIEKTLGRKDAGRWGPRCIDLDILYCGALVMDETDLRIPHPRLAERFFVLKPLADLAPGWRDPVSQKTVGQMLGSVGVPQRWKVIHETVI